MVGEIPPFSMFRKRAVPRPVPLALGPVMVWTRLLAGRWRSMCLGRGLRTAAVWSGCPSSRGRSSLAGCRRADADGQLSCCLFASICCCRGGCIPSRARGLADRSGNLVVCPWSSHDRRLPAMPPFRWRSRCLPAVWSGTGDKPDESRKVGNSLQIRRVWPQFDGPIVPAGSGGCSDRSEASSTPPCAHVACALACVAPALSARGGQWPPRTPTLRGPTRVWAARHLFLNGMARRR